MASFSWKNAHFTQPSPFKPKFENVPLALRSLNFVCLGLRHRANYSSKNFPYNLPFSYFTFVTNGQMDKQTDRQTTHRAIDAL